MTSPAFPLGAQVLVWHMDLATLDAQTAVGSTATMIVASRGHLGLAKRVLYRINDLGCKPAVLAHMSLQNNQAVLLLRNELMGSVS